MGHRAAAAAFLDLAAAGAIQGPVLDAGCGTGEHTLMCAGLGLDVTGIDLAARALGTAQAKARQRSLQARFLRQDARHLPDLGETFGTVLDCGLFHVFGDADRTAYTAGLRAVLVPGGRYFMLCFSDRQPGELGTSTQAVAETRSPQALPPAGGSTLSRQPRSRSPAVQAKSRRGWPP